MDGRRAVSRFCLCRGPDGRRLRGDCPDLRDRRHGTWGYGVRLDTTTVRRRQLKRSGFDTKAQATAALEHVRALVALAGDDDRLRRRIGDIVFEKSARGGQLPAVEEVRKRVGAGMDVIGPRLTVAEWLTERLAARRDLKQSTLRTARAHVDTWLAPFLGDVPLDRLRPMHITELFDFIEQRNDEVRAAQEERRPVRPDPRDGRRDYRVTDTNTQRRIFATLRACLNAAVKARMIDWNPCIGVEMPGERRYVGRVWSPEQVGAFLAAAEGDRLAALFRLVLLRGLRRGEVCGLRWSDVDLDAGCLEVRQTLLQAPGGYEFGTPKSRAGERRVSLDAGTVAALRAHRRAQLRERLLAGEAYEDHGLVFAREDGTPVDPKAVSWRFKQIARAAGLPVIRFHDGRHTAATLGLRAGLDVKIVSDQLGHSTTRITQDLYQHVEPAVHDRAAEMVANLLPTETRKAAN